MSEIGTRIDEIVASDLAINPGVYFPVIADLGGGLMGLPRGRARFEAWGRRLGLLLDGRADG